MWHKAEWMGRPMRLELILTGLLATLTNHYTTRDAQELICIILVSFYINTCVD